MTASFKVVDLFAGPGGLAEGFSSLRSHDGSRVFDIALSIEMEPNAFSTLRLRSFFRQFERPPEDYYDYIAGRISKKELIAAYPVEWGAAEKETMQLKLGPDTRIILDPILEGLRKDPTPIVLIGGPPCQAYSIVGRNKNRSLDDYDPARDERNFLYREYIRIINKLQPAAFVMENVQGILSSKVAKEQIFPRILTDLQGAGGENDSYTLLPLVQGAKGAGGGFLIRCEEYGIPQRRHRVIVVGIRSDLVGDSRSGLVLEGLAPAGRPSTVKDVLYGMPELRSGITPEKDDGPESWRSAAVAGMRRAAEACSEFGDHLSLVASRLEKSAMRLAKLKSIPRRSSSKLTSLKDNRLGAWLSDPQLDTLPNHETRGHKPDDLARYAFVAAFGQVFGRSPKSKEFPEALAPEHRNWKTGYYGDRFRVQVWDRPSTTVVSHISKDGHAFIHPDLEQCRSLTVREAARLQTFPDNYFFEGKATNQRIQVGNAVPPLMARQVAEALLRVLHSEDDAVAAPTKEAVSG